MHILEKKEIKQTAGNQSNYDIVVSWGWGSVCFITSGNSGGLDRGVISKTSNLPVSVKEKIQSYN